MGKNPGRQVKSNTHLREAAALYPKTFNWKNRPAAREPHRSPSHLSVHCTRGAFDTKLAKRCRDRHCLYALGVDAATTLEHAPRRPRSLQTSIAKMLPPTGSPGHK